MGTRADVTAEKLAHLIQQGLGVVEIAERLDCGYNTVRRRAEAAGLRFPAAPPSRSITPEDVARMITLYGSGLSTHSIAHQTGFGQRAVYRRLRDAGIEMRKPGRAPIERPRCIYCGVAVGLYSRYCSAAHQNAYARDRYIERWLRGEENGATPGNSYWVSQYVVKWLWQRAGDACERCGWNTVHPRLGYPPLQVHHVDGTNRHVPDNLELLCPNCHALTDHFGYTGQTGRSTDRGF